MDILPLDSESCHSGLLCKHVAADLFDDRLRRRIGVQILVIVFVVHVVSNAYEFSSIVGAGEENDSDAEDFRRRQAGGVGRIGFKDELVNTDGDGPDEQGVEFLIVFCGRGRADVSEFPF